MDSPLLPVVSFMDEAWAHVRPLREPLGLTSAVLDRWGGAVRIIYGSPEVRECRCECRECSLFKTVGVDGPGVHSNAFATTLVSASRAALDTFPSRQVHLNCKTFEQYIEAFIVWLTIKCHTEEELRAELKLVKGFKVLFVDGAENAQAAERDAKIHIVRECLARMSPGDSRRFVVLQIADELGLAG